MTVPAFSGTLTLTQLHMVTPITGWGLAVPGDGQGLGHLVHTSDGGAHWIAVGMPASLNTPNLDAFDIHDGQTAWVLVMLGAESTPSHETVVVASTSDAGDHWSATAKFTIDGHGTGIQFVDSSHGWVFATPGAGGALGSGDTTLYRTVDGGARWQPIKPPSEVRQDRAIVGGLPEACPMGGPISQPVFTDAQIGWLGAFCSQPFFYGTHDGGLSWSRLSLPEFPGPTSGSAAGGLDYNVDSFQVMSSAAFSLLLHRGITTGANALQDAALYVTTDAGASWAAYRLPAAALNDDFIDPAHGWMIAAGAGGNTEIRSLFSTVDGGRSWRLVDGPAGYYAGGVNFVDPQTGFIAVPATADSAPELLRSTDGGRTWGGIQTTIS